MLNKKGKMLKVILCVLLGLAAHGVYGAHFQGGAFSWRHLRVRKLQNDERGLPIQVKYNVGYFGFRTSLSPGNDKPTKHQTCTKQRIDSGQLLTTKGYIKCDGQCSSHSNLTRWVDMTWICTDYSEEGDWDIGGRKWIEWVPEGTTSMIVYHESCCWVGPLENIYKRDNVGYMMMTEINMTRRSDNGRINSSPITSPIPVQQYHRNCYNWLEIPVHDPDGDPYRCRWKELYRNECYKDEWEMCGPIAKVHLFENCTVRFDSHGDPGLYGAAVTIEDLDEHGEPRSRITLSFLFNVTEDDTTCKTPVIIEPKIRCKTIPVDQPHQMKVVAEAATDDLPISRIDITKPPLMTVSPELADVPGYPLRKSVTLNWTPNKYDVAKTNKVGMNAVDSKGFISGWSYMMLNVVKYAQLLLPVQSESLPQEGQEVDNTYEWRVAFSKQIKRPQYPAYIWIVDSNGGVIDKLDASKEEVRFSETSVAFDVAIEGNVSFVSNLYKIIVDEGVAIDATEGPWGDDCPLKSSPAQWNFTWRGIKPATKPTPTIRPGPPVFKCKSGLVDIDAPTTTKDGEECFIIPGETSFIVTGATVEIPYNLCCPSNCPVYVGPPGTNGPPGIPGVVE